jgi:hypothetical protein
MGHGQEVGNGGGREPRSGRLARTGLTRLPLFWCDRAVPVSNKNNTQKIKVLC